MTSNQHYNYDDNHLQQQPQHHLHGDINSPHDHDDNDGQSRFDPCQATSNETCIDACQAMSSVNHVTMCGGVYNYFNNNNEDDGEGLDYHSSPYLYSPSAPVGPSRCEYCGKRNMADCQSNLPQEYMTHMCNGINGNGDSDMNGDSCNSNPESSAQSTANNHTTQNNNNNTAQDADVCHRPKLFFLKKRPPFATPDGWNPATEYRSNLFEPPSSVEGMGRGWGEVRGHLGNNAGGGGANNAAITNNQLNRSFANSGCGSSACAGAAETETSFSSATGGGGGDRGTNVSASDGGRSLSPVQWVSGLMEALSPSSKE